MRISQIIHVILLISCTDVALVYIIVLCTLFFMIFKNMKCLFSTCFHFFQVTYQLKILTTAVLSVIMLKKQLSKVQWVSLVVLFIGVSTVQLQPENLVTSKSSVPQNPFIGLVAVVTACIMSGFAGVYFEKILKGTQQSVWLRNVQLGGIGTVVGYITMELNDGMTVREKGFFYGYDKWVWFVILLQSCGGLIVAVVVKYADNILKGFATSAAIIISCIGSMFLFSFSLSKEFTLGATLVIVATYLYSKYVPPKPSPVIAPSSKIVQT